MKGWTTQRMEAAGIKPLARFTFAPYGEVLIGERHNKVWRGSEVAEVIQTFWFLQRDGIEVGRALDWEQLARPDGSPITLEDRLMCAAKDAGQQIPLIVEGQRAYWDATYTGFARAEERPKRKNKKKLN